MCLREGGSAKERETEGGREGERERERERDRKLTEHSQVQPSPQVSRLSPQLRPQWYSCGVLWLGLLQFKVGEAVHSLDTT